MIEALKALRDDGWSVAVHNDYRQNGEAFTFWLLTHPDGSYVKGEGRTDTEALDYCFAQAMAKAATALMEDRQSDRERIEVDCFICPDCGLTKADEDGCCSACGADCTEGRAIIIHGTQEGDDD